MDYKAEMIRLRQWLQTEVDFINDNDSVPDKFARQANRETIKRIDQILERGEKQIEPEATALSHGVSGSDFDMSKIIDEYSQKFNGTYKDE